MKFGIENGIAFYGFEWIENHAVEECDVVHVRLKAATIRERTHSAVKISRPVESISDEQLQLKPALLSFSAIALQFLHTADLCLVCSRQGNDKMIAKSRR